MVVSIFIRWPISSNIRGTISDSREVWIGCHQRSSAAAKDIAAAECKYALIA